MSTKHPAFGTKGITLVEVLMVISVLIILVSFALPASSTATSKAELTATTETIRHSIDAARNIARLTESGVEFKIVANGQDGSQLIRFNSASKPDQSIEELQQYRLPSQIRLVSDRTMFAFDERGLVESAGEIVLVSLADESARSILQIK